MARRKGNIGPSVHVAPAVEESSSLGSDKDFDPHAMSDDEHSSTDDSGGDYVISASVEIAEPVNKQKKIKSAKLQPNETKNKSRTMRTKDRKNVQKHAPPEQKKKKSGKAVFLSRCSPNRLVTICTSLTHEQRDAVREMGFGGLLHVKCTRLARRVCLKLVKCFDIRQLCIYAKGEEIRLSYRDVGNVLGLPQHGMEVPESTTAEQRAMLKEFDRITDVQLTRIICQGRVDLQFRRAFLLYVLSCFLCPTLKLAPCPQLLGSVIDIENVQKYNWSLFVFKWLVRHVKSYKSRQYKSKMPGIGGCIFLLKILYFHKRPLSISPSHTECPLVQFWDDDLLEKRIREEKINVLGLLYHAKDKGDLIDPLWLKENFQTELFRSLVADSIRMYKAQEDAALAGNRLVLPSTSTMSAPKQTAMPRTSDPECSTSKGAVASSKAGQRTTDEVDNIRVGDGGHTSPIVRTDEGHAHSTALKVLYEFCIRKPCTAKAKEEVLVSMCGYFLNRVDTRSMGRRQQLCNNVVSLASAVFNDTDLCPTSKSRYCLPSYFMESVHTDLNNFMNDKLVPWQKLPTFFPATQPRVITSDFIFAPVLYEAHWWCYVVEAQKKKLYVLDSLHSSHRGNMAFLDKLTAKRFEEIFAFLDIEWDITDAHLEIEYPRVPKQHNGYDCGVHTIKYMEIWDGAATYEGDYTMPAWTEDEVAAFRRDLLTKWVLHPKNQQRDHVISSAKVHDLLPTPSQSVLRSPCYEEQVSSHQVEPHSPACIFEEGNEKRDTSQVHDTDVGETTHEVQDQPTQETMKVTSNIGPRVRQQTY